MFGKSNSKWTIPFFTCMTNICMTNMCIIIIRYPIFASWAITIHALVLVICLCINPFRQPDSEADYRFQVSISKTSNISLLNYHLCYSLRLPVFLVRANHVSLPSSISLRLYYSAQITPHPYKGNCDSEACLLAE